MGRLTSRPTARGFRLSAFDSRLSAFSLLVCAVLIVAASVAAPAQDLDDVTIAGRVADESGASVAGARVTATLAATGASRAAATDEEGRFRLVELPPGAYTLRVSGGSLMCKV